MGLAMTNISLHTANLQKAILLPRNLQKNPCISRVCEQRDGLGAEACANILASVHVLTQRWRLQRCRLDCVGGFGDSLVSRCGGKSRLSKGVCVRTVLPLLAARLRRSQWAKEG